MTPPRTSVPLQVPHYRLPELLQDIRLLDLLELCGTAGQTSSLLRLSQPTISRPYRILAEDFGLVRDRRQLWGCVYGTSAAMLRPAPCPPAGGRGPWLELLPLGALPPALRKLVLWKSKNPDPSGQLS